MKRISFVTACALLLCCCSSPKEEEPEKPVVAVKLAPAETMDLPQVVNAPATIFPHEQANIAARITAPIRELLVKKGDSVRAGQLLATLENREAAAQRQEAQAAVEDAQANLQKTIGGTVPADLERARGQVETSRAALDQAQKNYDRRRQLFEQGAIAQRDVLQSQTELATARSNAEVARRSLELIEQQSGGQDIAIAKSRVEQARARLSASSANLQYTELRSPFAGTITEQYQYPGDMAGPGTPTYTIMDLSSVTARAQVPQASAGSLRVGQRCSFVSGESSGVRGDGVMSVVNRAIDPARRTLEVWCEIKRPPVSLRAGVFGTASIDVAAIGSAVVVPEAAVQVNEGTETGVVFVVDSKRIAHRREVHLGVRAEDRIQIRSGIAAGDQIVVEGAYSLPDGAQVRLPGDKDPGSKP